jgi:2,3-bisphosphoglycerate-independent phosphoglycerate mutase
MSAATGRPRPVVLVVLDGVGARDDRADNAVRLASTPVLCGLEQRGSRAVLAASGPAVGLGPGCVGNSEVAHIALGSGRPPVWDGARIDAAIREGSLATNPALRAILARTKDFGGRLHLIGLVSEGGVHASLSHLAALIDLAKKARVRVVVHALLDGRDVPSGTARHSLADLEASLAGGVGRIGTVAGRFWGMDRDGRWDRIAKCYRAILAAEVRRVDTALQGIEESYAAGESDELVEPFVVFDYPGVSPVDAAIHVDFRADRARELAVALAAPSFHGFARKGGRAPFLAKAGRFAAMTTLDPSLDLPTAFPRIRYPNTLPEVLARCGYRQLRCAESEKEAHVTTFFNAGREEPFEAEDRRILPSRRDVTSYDKAPEMSAPGVAQAAEEAIRSGKYDFVLVNFANPDAVGHTGVLDAAIRAVEATDAGLGRIVEATRAVGGALVVVGSHGNCEVMRDPETGAPHTRHTTNPVPLFYVHGEERIRESGTLCDVAPTLLDLFELPQPPEMTGRSLRR